MDQLSDEKKGKVKIWMIGIAVAVVMFCGFFVLAQEMIPSKNLVEPNDRMKVIAAVKEKQDMENVSAFEKEKMQKTEDIKNYAESIRKEPPREIMEEIRMKAPHDFSKGEKKILYALNFDLQYLQSKTESKANSAFREPIVQESATFELPLQAPVREGYRFLGWMTRPLEPNEKVREPDICWNQELEIWYSGDSAMTTLDALGRDTTLYAVWTKETPAKTTGSFSKG